MKIAQLIFTGIFLIALVMVGCAAPDTEKFSAEPEEMADIAENSDSLTPISEVRPTIPTEVSTPEIIEAELLSDPVPVLDSPWTSIAERINELQGLYTLALSPAGDLFAAVESYDENSKVYLWENGSNEARWVLDLDQPLATTKLVFSPDGTQLAIGSSDIVPDIFIWDLNTGNLLHHFSYPATVRDMSFSQDNSLLAVAGIFPGKISIFDLVGGSVNEVGMGNAVSFVPGVASSVIAVASERQFGNDLPPIYLLDLNDGQQKFLLQNEFFADGVAVSQDGQYLATFVFNEEGYGNLRVVNLQNNVELEMEANEVRQAQQIRQITFSNNGHLGVLQRDLTIWNINGDFLGSIDALEAKGFLFTSDGFYVITFGNFQTSPQIWKLPVP